MISIIVRGEKRLVKELTQNNQGGKHSNLNEKQSFFAIQFHSGMIDGIFGQKLSD